MNSLKLTKSVLILLSLSLVADCSGISPAAPPAPPAELPSALTIPSSVTINVDEIRSSSGSALTALVAPGGTFSEDITFGGDQATQENQFVDDLLAPLHAFTIPVTPATNHFEGDTDVGGATFHVKIDFSDFNFDGKTASCSGNTAALPICFRVWANDNKRLAGVFTAFPTDSNEGAGLFIGTKLDSKDAEGVESGLTRVFYDRTDPSNPVTEISLGVGLSSGPSDPPDFLIKAHALTTQTGPEGHTVKAVFVSASVDLGGGSASTGQYVGRFKEAADFWSGTVDLKNPSTPRTFSDQCAQISSGFGVLRSDCLNLGIDIDGLPFIDFMNPTDVLLPADFPNTPTF